MLKAAELKSLQEASDSLRKLAKDAPKGAVRDLLKSYAGHLKSLKTTAAK